MTSQKGAVTETKYPPKRGKSNHCMLLSAENILNTASTGLEEQVSMAPVTRSGRWTLRSQQEPRIKSVEDMHEVPQYHTLPWLQAPWNQFLCRSWTIMHIEKILPCSQMNFQWIANITTHWQAEAFPHYQQDLGLLKLQLSIEIKEF